MTPHVADRYGIRHVTLRRPPVNALTRADYLALAAAFTSGSDGDPPQLVVLRADGDVWSAGQDLDDLPSAADAGRRIAYLEQSVRAVAAVAASRVPTLAVLDGPAVGAGALLIACADIVVASPEGSVAFPELQIGVNLGPALVRDFLPPAALFHAFATGDPVPAERLAEMGAVQSLVPRDQLDRTARDLIERLLRLPSGALPWLRVRRDPSRRAQAYLRELEDVTEVLRSSGTAAASGRLAPR